MSQSADHASPQQPSSLDSRPEAISLSIEGLLGYVDQGRVRVPSFQRPLRWEAEDIQLLFDSIYRGFPVGTLLFWKRSADAESIDIGPRHLDVPSRQDALWVVDGQQRITALTGVLSGPYDDLDSKYVLFFDLTNETFVRPNKRTPVQPTWLPLDRVVDSETLLLWLNEHQDLTKPQVRIAIRLGKRVREYQLPAYVIETDDEAPLRDIFDRSNSAGRAMKANEVFDALHGRRKGQTPSGTRAIAEELQKTGFGHIDEDFILKALLAILGKDLQRDFRAQVAREEVTRGLPVTARALKETVIFVHRYAGIPHVDLMPYKLPLVTLARLFSLHPEPSPRSRTLLARWLWRGAINERHQGNSELTSGRILNLIDADEVNSVQALIENVGGKPEAPLALTPFNFRYARSKLHALALWALKPRHLVTGRVIRIAELMQQTPPTHPIKRHRVDLARGLPNILLHPPIVGGFWRPLLAQRDPDVLRSHGISDDVFSLVIAGDFERFLQRRAEFLREYVRVFLGARAQWSASDRPPISSLIVED